MRGKLPEAVLNRKKTGFDIPAHDWFRGPLRGLLLDTLTAEAIEANGDLRCARNPVADTRSYGEAHQCRISPMGPADAVPLDEDDGRWRFPPRRRRLRLAGAGLAIR